MRHLPQLVGALAWEALAGSTPGTRMLAMYDEGRLTHHELVLFDEVDVEVGFETYFT